SAGRHDLWAVSGTGGRWEAMARLEPDVPEGAAFVPAWHAVHEAEGNPDGLPDRLPTLALLALGGALAVWPRRSKSP
ncbi:MAG TPA: hypothetical protein VI796_02595, partial [Candidatus Thermoplasmatota archaeon]|nr:hypothetical protein [Candidatus Thermoplasmatota archaeon]